MASYRYTVWVLLKFSYRILPDFALFDAWKLVILTTHYTIIIAAHNRDKHFSIWVRKIHEHRSLQLSSIMFYYSINFSALITGWIKYMYVNYEYILGVPRYYWVIHCIFIWLSTRWRCISLLFTLKLFLRDIKPFFELLFSQDSDFAEKEKINSQRRIRPVHMVKTIEYWRSLTLQSFIVNRRIFSNENCTRGEPNNIPTCTWLVCKCSPHKCKKEMIEEVTVSSLRNRTFSE